MDAAIIRNQHNPTYRTWNALRRRCNDPENEDYGGRGITYDPRWDDFWLFIEDMGMRPPGYTIDRIDPGGPYTKNNCKWSTPEAQQNNRTICRHLTINGETLTVTQWARRVGISPPTLFSRLYCGWAEERAVLTPARKKTKT